MKARHLAIDILAIVIFAVLARMAHQTPEMPFGLSGIVETGWPFLLGVLIAWLFVFKSRTASLASGLVVWIVTVVVGLGIWSVRHGMEMPHWSFVLVASVMSGLLLLGWRSIFNLVARKKS